MTTADLGKATLGVWSREEALSTITRGQLDRKVRSGTWQVVWPGVYADGGYVLAPEQRAVAAVLATGETLTSDATRVTALACGRTAARAWRLPLIDDDDPSTGVEEHGLDDVHTFRAISGRSGTVAHDGRVLTRQRLTLLPDDIRRLSCGVRLTSALRTACDCALLLPFDAAVALMDAGLHRNLFTEQDLAAAIAARAGWPGVQRLREVAAAADGRAESPAESVARLVLLPVLPGLVPQVTVRDGAGRVVARLDLADEEIKFAVEVDGKRGHAGPQMVAKDRRRDRRTQPFGFATERVTWHECRTRPDATRRWVAESAARHAERSL